MNPGTRNTRHAPTWLALILAPAFSACVTASATSTVAVEGVPSVLPEDRSDTTSAVPEPAVTAEAVDTARAESAVDIDSLIVRVRKRLEIPRERSILPFGVIWSPERAEEGSAVAFRILLPRGGKEPDSVEGSLAGHRVRFGRIGGAWVGLGAVPIGRTGVDSLHLDFRFADGSEYRQTATVDVASRSWDRTSMRVAPRYSSPPPEVQARIAREREEIRAVLDAASPAWLVDGDFETPRPFDVTSPYGQERVFNGEMQSRHTGLDLRGTVGAPVYAAGRGRVALAGDFYFSGNGIYIDHGLGVYTGYFHLSEILVTEGAAVEKGQLIGRVGATGRVTGPHLHWSLWVDGVGLDASSLLEMHVPQP